MEWWVVAASEEPAEEEDPAEEIGKVRRAGRPEENSVQKPREWGWYVKVWTVSNETHNSWDGSVFTGPGHQRATSVSAAEH